MPARTPKRKHGHAKRRRRSGVPRRRVAPRAQAASEDAQRAQEWQQTFDAITDIVALISPEFRFIRVNRAGCRAAGKRESELVGRKCYEVIHGLKQPIAGCPCRRALQTRRPGSGELSSHGRCFIATADPVLDRRGRLVAFTHTVKDITDRKRAEEELARHREHLAELVKERTRDLEQAQAELVRQSRLATMGRVAGGLAREMRGPLEAVRVAADRLVQALTPAAGIEAARSLSSIQRATDRADRLLAAVLDFVQRTRPRPTRCSVRRILNLATTQASLPPGVTVHLSLPPGLPPVLVDEWRTVAVFDNLLANAAEAMAAGGTIGVFASLKGRRVAIAVSDTGSGIKPEHRKHLFEPLFTTKAYGVGLGLPIARAFVEDSGGSITVKSEPGRGATFVVTLPTAGAGAAGGVDA